MKTFKSRHEHLSAEEMRILQAINQGYGNFTGNAMEVGLHKNTYRYILRRGSGRRENIQKIRAVLLKHPQYESDPSEPGQNQAGSES